MTEDHTRETTQTLDSETLLRVLAQTALRVADGESVHADWLILQLRSDPMNRNPSPSPTSLFTITEAAERLRLSKWSIYDLIHKNQLLSVKIGRRRFIPSAELNGYLNSLPLTGGYLQ
ncbi:helix-turn-helix domain-containing protein [Nocardia sp. NPDC003482]